MANVKKALYNVAVFLVSLFITGSINVSNIKNTQDTSRVTLTVNEISQSFSTAKRDSG